MLDIESMTDSEFEAYLSGLTAEQVAAVMLVKYSPGITERALDAVFSVTMDTAEREGVDPPTVALELLAIREMPPDEQAHALPDPRLRAYLSGFLQIHDEPAAQFLAAHRIMDEEMAKFSRLSRPEQEALELAASAGEDAAAGPGVVGCVRDLVYAKAHTNVA